MFIVTVFIHNNVEPLCHRFSTFKRAVRKVRNYQQHFDCVCFLSFFDTIQKLYIVQRFTNSQKDAQIELHY